MTPAGSLEGHRGWVSRLVFAPDGQTLYSASSDQTIRVWDVAQKKEIETIGSEGIPAALRGSRCPEWKHSGQLRLRRVDPGLGPEVQTAACVPCGSAGARGTLRRAVYAGQPPPDHRVTE